MAEPSWEPEDSFVDRDGSGNIIRRNDIWGAFDKNKRRKYK